MTCVRVTPLAGYLAAAAILSGCGQANVLGNNAAVTAIDEPTVTLTADQASIVAGSSATLNWTTAEAASCSASGGWSGSVATSGTQAVTPSKTTTYDLACIGGGITASASTTVTVTAVVSGGGSGVSRPSYNTGDGFFVLNGKLYDPDGIEFRIRGVNRTHYDSTSEAGIVKSQANTARVFVTTQYGESWAGLENILQTQHVANQQAVIPTNAGDAAGLTSCSTSNATLTTAVSEWVSNAKIWSALNRYMLVNIANEWGPSNSTTWRDQYISAIQKLRAAGYTSPLLIDSGGCGQDINDLVKYAADVFNADPQKNIVFSFHLYGLTSAQQMPQFFAQMNGLQQSAGLVFVIGEFGPGRNIGPSPTLITPGSVITTAETNELGWMAWSWDDNDLGNCRSDNNWFSMTYNCGVYVQTSDLTLYGQDVVLNSTYGLQALAKKPNW